MQMGFRRDSIEEGKDRKRSDEALKSNEIVLNRVSNIHKVSYKTSYLLKSLLVQSFPRRKYKENNRITLRGFHEYA